MPNPFKVHRKNINRSDFNYLFFCMITVAVALSIYLDWKGVEGGGIYSSMFFGISGLMFWVFFWIKDDNTMKPITDYIRIPISTKLTLGSTLYLIGLACPFILYFISKSLNSSYNITNLSVPLFGSAIDQAFQTYSAAEISNNMAWRIFLVMFDAGTMETFVYNIGFPIISVLFGLLIFNYISKDGQTALFMSKKVFVVLIAVFLMPAGLFTLSHLMNSTYGFIEFVVASLFLIFSNASIYLMGMMALFWVGYHQANNLLALIIKYGFSEVAKGFQSWFGLMFTIFILLVSYYVVTHFPQTWYDLRDWWKNKGVA